MVFGYLNWTAPSTVKAGTQKTQANLLGYLGVDYAQSMSAVLMPTYATVRGGLWQQEAALMKNLSNQHVNLDRIFVLQHKAKADARDNRPVNLHGRLLFPLSIKENLEDSKWRTCDLASLGRTEQADMMKSADMSTP